MNTFAPSQVAAIPAQMRAIAIDGGAGPPEALSLALRTTPSPGPGEVLIRVVAAGVNFADQAQRQGAYPPPPGSSAILGLEVSGIVAALGEGVRYPWVGDRVCALLSGGGYAEYVTVDARHVLPVAAGLDLVLAGAAPETVFTVYANVFDNGRLMAGETLLVHGATSGVGVTAIALAKAAEARVITTSRGAVKAAQARALGADLAIDTSQEDFLEVVRVAGGADVILDMVGGDYFQKNLEALNPDGRLCQIAFLAGAEPTLNLQQLLLKRLSILGSALRNRSADDKARLTRGIEAEVWPWFQTGQLQIHVDRVFPLHEAAAAHRYLANSNHLGKIVLQVAEAVAD